MPEGTSGFWPSSRSAVMGSVSSVGAFSSMRTDWLTTGIPGGSVGDSSISTVSFLA